MNSHKDSEHKDSTGEFIYFKAEQLFVAAFSETNKLQCTFTILESKENLS